MPEALRTTSLSQRAFELLGHHVPLDFLGETSTYTGQVLPIAEVEEAMNAERASLAKFHVLKVVDDPQSAEVREACGSGEEAPMPIGTRWLINRKVSGKVKARIVAQQIKWTSDGMDTFAATATAAGARLLLAILAKRNRNGEDYVAILGDVKTAFLHSALPKGHQALLHPPTTEGLGEAFWPAAQALYGLRESPRTFQEHFADTLKKRTWRRLKVEPMIFIHESGALMSVFADDLLLIAPRGELEKVMRSIDIDVEVKWGDAVIPWDRHGAATWEKIGGTTAPTCRRGCLFTAGREGAPGGVRLDGLQAREDSLGAEGGRRHHGGPGQRGARDVPPHCRQGGVRTPE